MFIVAIATHQKAGVILGPQRRKKLLTHQLLLPVLLSDAMIDDTDLEYSLQCWHQRCGNMTEIEHKNDKVFYLCRVSSSKDVKLRKKSHGKKSHGKKFWANYQLS